MRSAGTSFRQFSPCLTSDLLTGACTLERHDLSPKPFSISEMPLSALLVLLSRYSADVRFMLYDSAPMTIAIGVGKPCSMPEAPALTSGGGSTGSAAVGGAASATGDMAAPGARALLMLLSKLEHERSEMFAAMPSGCGAVARWLPRAAPLTSSCREWPEGCTPRTSDAERANDSATWLAEDAKDAMAACALAVPAETTQRTRRERAQICCAPNALARKLHNASRVGVKFPKQTVGLNCLGEKHV